jgi:hypothetical protein
MKNIDYKWMALSCTSLGALLSVLSQHINRCPSKYFERLTRK